MAASKNLRISANSPSLCKIGRPVAFERRLRYAMELRLKTARTTHDMDLALKQLPIPTRDWDANASTVLEALREVGQLDLEDFFTFVFGDAVQDLDAAPYGGARS